MNAEANRGEELHQMLLIEKMDRADILEGACGNVPPGMAVDPCAVGRFGMLAREPVDADELAPGSKPLMRQRDGASHRVGRVMLNGGAIDHEVEEAIEGDRLREIAHHDRLA